MPAERRPVRLPEDVVRIVLTTNVLAATALAARQGRVTRSETNLFRLINKLPAQLYRPVWLVMQGGSLAAVFVTGGAALTAGRTRMARDLAVNGLAAWLTAKLLKPWIGRARPEPLLHEVIVRQGGATGTGFPSGHAAVAAALVTAAAPYLPRRHRRLLWGEAWLVAIGRMYVGVHLPLDALGGAALGGAISSATHLAWGRPDDRRPSVTPGRPCSPVRRTAAQRPARLDGDPVGRRASARSRRDSGRGR